MTVVRTRENVFTGFADMYYGNAGLALPDENAVARGGAWPAGWSSVGLTEDGMEFEVSKDTEDIQVEEILTPVRVAFTGVGVIARFSAAEDTVEMMQLAFGFGTIATTAAASGQIGKKRLTLNETLKEYSFGFEGDVPGGHWRRALLPNCISVGTVGTSYRKNGKRLYPVEIRAICEPSDIIIDTKTADALA